MVNFVSAAPGFQHHQPHGYGGQYGGHPYSVAVSGTSPYSLSVSSGGQIVAANTAILIGNSNSSAAPVSASWSGQISNGAGQISASLIEPNVVKVSVNTTSQFVGARFATSTDANFYGVWEYPWFEGLTNANVSFDLKGLGNSDGINWDNARAPFFFTSAGYGVYADTLDMGSFDFTTPGQAQFIFNTSSLVYYITLPTSPGNYKSILETYTGLSSRIELPPDSGYGPTFWSDNFEQDFHAGVHNAQENYYDVINHLYYNQIHASSMFADRPYGTGNSSWGNFDFDPVYYPTPVEFIANLSDWGFDFQVWVANRAFLDTELFNVSEANGWLFPGISPEFFLGPALNLSIPAAYDYLKERLSYFPSVGVKGYKIDRGEEGELPGRSTIPQFRTPYQRTRSSPKIVYEQNIQNSLFEQLCYETMVEKWNESNFYDFARSAVDHSRSRTYIWNGDSHSNFSGLAYSVASGIRAGLVGFPQWGSDTGGYIRGLNDPSAELWARWMWFSAFSPVYEIMIGTNHTPWYPPYDSDLVAVLKESANLHHDLLPFIRSYIYQATQNGLPLIRALFLEAPADENTLLTTDEYFFGSEFLVAPIVNAGGSRSVYFPAGSTYLEYFNKTAVHQGGTTAEVQLGVHYVPVYVRAGSIIPRGDIYQGNNKWTEDWKPELTIEVYPSFEVGRSEFSYYDRQSNETVPIVMDTSKTGKVVVVYGDSGAPGTIELFAKSGVQTETLQAGGGKAVFTGVESLFD